MNNLILFLFFVISNFSLSQNIFNSLITKDMKVGKYTLGAQYVNDKGEIEFCSEEMVPPQYFDGSKAFEAILNKAVQFHPDPKTTRRKKSDPNQSEDHFRFIIYIDTTGHVEEIQVERSPNDLTEEKYREAMWDVKRFIPAKCQGVAIRVRIGLTVKMLE